MQIPDYFEPLIGWRTWGGIDRSTGGLKAYARNYYWLPGKPVQSICDHCGGPAKPAFTPGQFSYKGGNVGMYAFKTIHQLCQDMAFGPVIGQVYLWGQIVEHTRGYRAEFAYPKALITTYEADAALLREKWNVEVEVGNVQNIYEQTKRSIMRKLEAEYLKERGE